MTDWNVLWAALTKRRVAWLALFLLSLALRLPAAVDPPAALIYNVDEIDFLKSTIGVIFGLTPTNLQWPAGVPMFICVPLILAHWFLTSELARVSVASADLAGLLSSLTGYAGENLYDPRRLLVITRVFIALLASTAPVVAIAALGRFLDENARAIVGIVLATSPALIAETSILKGDAIGLIFWSMSAYCILRSWADNLNADERKHNLLAACFFLGLATASRFTYAVVFPPLLVAVVARLLWPWRASAETVGEGLRHLVTCVVAFAVPLAVFVPYLLTHSLTAAKQLLGNLVYLTAASHYASHRTVLLGSPAQQVGWIALACAVVGAVTIWREKGRVAAIASWLMFLVFFLPLAGSRYLELRYTLPLLPILALWAATGSSSVSRWAKWRWNWPQPTTCGILALLIVGTNVASVNAWWKRSQQPTAATRLVDWLNENVPANRSIAIPYTLALYVPPDEAALSRLLHSYATDEESARKRLSNLLGKVGRPTETRGELPSHVINALFGGWEAIDAFQYATMRYAARRGRAPGSARDVRYYVGGEAEKPDQIPYDEAIELFQSGRLDYIVTRGQDPRLGERQPAACPSSWCVYVAASR